MERLLRLAQARKLDRIAVAYAVAGWLLVQGASIVLPAFDAAASMLRVFIVAVVIGFPAALTIAWFAAPPAKSKDATADVSQPEQELDKLVYALYSLTPDEIKIVEGVLN